VPAGMVLTDRHATPLRRLLADGYRAGGTLPLEEMPPFLIDATLAAEDQRFFSHGGFDPMATLRAMRDGLQAGRRVSGASTITQQLVKMVVRRPRTLRTKLLEFLTARRIEMTWGKAQILTQYFARLEYGNLHRGPAAAAQGYFGKPLLDCSPAECAFLAGLPQSPTRLNPWRDPAPARQRQQWILQRLRALGHVDPLVLDRALVEPLQLRRHYGNFAAPHFVDLLQEQTGPGELSGRAGPNPRTSLDLPIQELCEDTVRDRLSRLRERHVSQAAVVVIDNATGEVRALVGSQDYAGGKDGQVNGATSRRSPGSALKPFTYLLALSHDLSPASILADLPIEYMTATGLYRPQNYHHRAAGPVSLRTALANSLNLSAVRLLESHGGPAALITSLQAAGLTTLTKPPAEYGLGLTIGGGEVTLLELTAAYSTLARLGRVVPLRFTPGSSAPGGQQLYDPDACWLLADILSDNNARVRTFGTSSALRLPFPCAVKTGTSTDYRDNWTIGYNAAFTVGVWVGNFDNSPMRGVSGVSGAAPIFRDIFSWLDTHFPVPWYPQPPTILVREVDPLTGLPVPSALSGRRPSVREKFRRDLAPNRADPMLYDAQGRVLLPAEYHAWLAGPENVLGTANAAPGPLRTDQPWRITSPLPGTTLLLDPDLPQGGRSLPLRVDPPQVSITWSSPTLQIEQQRARLVPGRHQLTARESATGKEASTWVLVRRL
jgi:penicillin-binding protein 1C